MAQKRQNKLTLYMLRVAKIDIDLYNISVHRFAGHSKIPSIKCSGHFGGLMFPQLFDLSWNITVKSNDVLDHFGSFCDIFRGSPSKESGPRSQHRGLLSCLLKIPGNIGGSLGIPWGDGALTDLEGDRVGSDSLEIKACRPIKTQ